MKILFFDTETTHLYNFNSTHNDPEQPGIVQIGAIGVDQDKFGPEKDILKFSLLLNSGKESTDGAINVHGYDNEYIQQNGFSYYDGIKFFQDIVEKYDLLVGHNIAYDINCFKAQCVYLGIETDIMNMRSFCTMEANWDVYKHRQSLSSIYKYYTGETLDKAHDAYYDIEATKLVFYKTLERKKNET